MRVVNLKQAEYKQFKRRVAILQEKGIELDFSVAQPNKRVVKITLNKEYDWNKLDEVCENG
tara:strand:+ start:951 stop:1133 length:183 start_codon:yes stop_codon:yes gene_type:complete